MPAALPTTFPHGRTARRLDWPHLPPLVRRAVERRLGSRVTDSMSQDAGFTPGLASVVICEDGSRHFVKAASTKAQRPFAEAYREEARRLRTLPRSLPAPRLLWVHDADDWVVLGIEYVEGRAPARPWTEADLAACSSMLVDAAAALTPAPGLGLATFAEEFASFPDYWTGLRDVPHAGEAAALAGRLAEIATGDTLVHTDVRDDNLILAGDGSVWLCDWNWPVLGPAWFDSLTLLIGPRGDGLDVSAHLAAHPLLSAVDPDSIDIALALVTGYFLASARQPVPTTSPYLRDAQRWQGEVCHAWLAERRGWRI
ncbi:phosphotransferase family protein [Nocardioides sp.]|uniref:phosphotransferase family protein n=1 Tax=Nocardioides sp. TaxID=35761 RepID=UPI0039E3D810